jgi:DoxX-like family
MDGAKGGRPGSIYVEILVRSALDEIWSLTQRPDLHQRWDLRFSEIEYLPRPDESLPQRFLYTTRIGFGLAVRGRGESAGTREGDGGPRTSALKFWSADPKSLIREGSGYWRYVPVPGGVRFLTRYDYRTRFGLPGRLLDRALFRPLLGWATAWSFDRLRIWIERGIDPRASRRRWLVDLAARLVLAPVLVAHGLVPMLIDRSPAALRLLVGAGLAPAAARQALPLIGIAEVALGAVLLAGRVSRRDLPSAARCRRAPAEPA